MFRGEYGRPMWRFLIGFFFQTAPGVMLVPLITLGLAARGVESWLIGALATVGSLSYIAALPAAPLLMRRMGEQGAFRLAVAGGALANLGLVLANWPALLVALYALAGLAAGVRFTLAESWAPAFAPPAVRGRAMALFQTSVGASAFVGAGLLIFTGIEGVTPRIVIIGSTLLGLILLWPVQAPATAHAPAAAPSQGSLRAALGLVGPVVLGAALLGGLFESGLWVALPLYGLASGLGPELAVGLVTAMGLGSLAQYPYGALADHFGWRGVALGAAGVIAVSALLLPLAHAWPGLLFLLGVLWGSAGGGLYTLATIRNGALYGGAQLVGASVVTQFAYMIGDATGPVLGGLALDLSPQYGLSAILTIAGIAGLALLIGRPWGAHRRPQAAGAEG